LRDHAATLSRQQFQCNTGSLPVEYVDAPRAKISMDAAEAIKRMMGDNVWIAFKNVERSPVFKDIVRDTFEEISTRLGLPEMARNMESSIIISSQGAITPFHMDPDHVFLLQISGRKRIKIARRANVEEEELERFFRDNFRNIPMKESLAQSAETFDMEAGQGVYIPVTSPHWVEVTEGPSVSINFAYRCDSSTRREHLLRMNAHMRRLGLCPNRVGSRNDETKLQRYRKAVGMIANLRPSRIVARMTNFSAFIRA
jgi:hypothetical protein